MGQSIDGYCYQDSFTVLGGGSLLDNGFNTPFCGIIKGYSSKYIQFFAAWINSRIYVVILLTIFLFQP
jgi:hypothetical protein